MTDDERRERYAAAMGAIYDAGPEWAFEWYPEADVAMAVADEEQQELQDAGALMGKALHDAHRENVSLRVELESTYDRAVAVERENARLRAEVARVNEAHSNSIDVNNRLRADLYEAESRSDYLQESLNDSCAVIERVREVTDAHDVPGSYTIVAEICAALGGEDV